MVQRETNTGFTLVELLISMSILALIVLFVSRLFNSAASITTAGNRHMDCDLEARQVFNRMAVDFSQMIKRSDVDCYLKGLDPETGNDKIAFFSQVAGYYPATGSQSPTSLIAYRINAKSDSPSFNKMERMGKGLVWNGVSSSSTPLVFGQSPTLVNNWPTAIDATSPDLSYETIGPQTFRFEYFYFMRNGNLSAAPIAPGLQDVSAISVCIAVADPKSKTLLSTSQISTLAGRMTDFSSTPSTRPGDLLSQWQSALNGTTDMPRTAVSSIRLYQRTFQLSSSF